RLDIVFHARLWQKQPDLECRTLAQPARDTKFPSHQLRQHLADGQPQPCAANALGSTPTQERLEYMVDLFHPDTRAAIFHLDRHHFPCIVHTKNHTALARELDRIAENIDQYLTQAFMIRTDDFG